MAEKMRVFVRILTLPEVSTGRPAHLVTVILVTVHNSNSSDSYLNFLLKLLCKIAGRLRCVNIGALGHRLTDLTSDDLCLMTPSPYFGVTGLKTGSTRSSAMFLEVILT